VVPDLETPREPTVRVVADEAELRLRSADGTPLTFHRWSHSATLKSEGHTTQAVGFEEICTTPCTVRVPLGILNLAVSLRGHPPRAADPVYVSAGRMS
jgi:hypothetical protein